MAKWLLRPIASLARTMEDIEQSLVFRKIIIREDSKDELYALVVSFYRMMDRIEDNFKKAAAVCSRRGPRI